MNESPATMAADIPATATPTPALETPPQAAAVGLQPSWYYWIFAASGFAGLIYESLWARYLKLFLGHAAYAQILVLAVFLFGLAAGAALASRMSVRLQNPLRAYVVIEILLALAAVYFHDIFVVAEEWAVGFVLPRLEAAEAAELFKWTLATLLILPQSILLGATFPLMSAGLARLWPDKKGSIVSMLYFSNSLGAAGGVLVSGFVLVPFVGLPGTGIAAGFVNFFVATAVWILGHLFDNIAAPLSATRSAKTPLSSTGRLLLLTAAVTGAASFIYEIVWIRMLSLLLGSSTHSFEIMLSVFILGLAIGGLLIRKRANTDADPMTLLAKVQLVMGALALVSLIVYPYLFEALEFILKKIPRDNTGYNIYLLSGFLLSLCLMLPTTICAGMTLPLLTKRLMGEDGEGAIGTIYAANTLGSVVGAAVAMHILLPLLGAAKALAVGSGLDLALGLLLLLWLARRPPIIVITAAFLMAVFFLGDVDPRIAASGVFRHGQAKINDRQKVIFHRDGKTATISVIADGNTRSIKTNGKIDAGIIGKGDIADSGYTGDEVTGTLLGLLPLLIKPDANLAASIGLGSGMTSKVLLLSPQLQRLDTIEIEAMMVEGAKMMGERPVAAFNDPRSRIIIDDAKIFFARTRDKYDIIISEPSNPWVSGIAGLFSREFYHRIRSSLAEGGVFVQWTHLYETSPQIFASQIGALASAFSDFQLYLSSGSDVIFVAVAEGQVPPMLSAVFADNGARAFLSGYGFHSADDAKALFLGERKSMMPYLRSFKAPANSDYFPYVEINAPRAFFQKTFFTWGETATIPVPFMEMVTDRRPGALSVSPKQRSPLSNHYTRTQRWLKTLNDDNGLLRERLKKLVDCPLQADEAAGGKYVEEISSIVSILMPHASREEMAAIWRVMEENNCISELLQAETLFGRYVQFWQALSFRNAAQTAELAGNLRPFSNPISASGQMLILAEMAARYKLGEYRQVLNLIHQLPSAFPAIHHAARFIAANAAERL